MFTKNEKSRISVMTTQSWVAIGRRTSAIKLSCLIWEIRRMVLNNCTPEGTNKITCSFSEYEIEHWTISSFKMYLRRIVKQNIYEFTNTDNIVYTSPIHVTSTTQIEQLTILHVSQTYNSSI